VPAEQLAHEQHRGADVDLEMAFVALDAKLGDRNAASRGRAGGVGQEAVGVE